MSRSVGRTATLAAVVVAMFLLAGCTTDTPSSPLPSPSATVETETPAEAEAAVTPEPTPTDLCVRMSEVVSYTDDWRWERRQPLVDLGSREFARGEVTLDDDGHVVTYTVAPGDVEAVIAERLCAYPSLASLNHVRDLFPGQVLWLTPDPDTPWVPYFNPLDAEAGFAQIPYQNAITAAGLAVDAGDVETVRAIWNDTLADMFTDPATIEAVQKVVDAGDPEALRQLFS
ncbi:LysM peptidoglycan-binding domain-containing protein [Microbacterium paraoxydans]|uniref:LysM peptidoglycan-binding domain-containing protein n=1 Tax=Microbacterium paraoxydans TaxID=199592 RepID=UPI0011A73CF4|nr:LysM peptidoglycan-binding domain-containing protein [Microbacterium paraoxydans]